MSSSVAIEVVIEDDVFSAPESKKIATTIIVKVPPKASLETVNTKIMEQYPALRNSWNMYYYIDDNGKFQKPQPNCGVLSLSHMIMEF